jgi:hypothetical protein
MPSNVIFFVLSLIIFFVGLKQSCGSKTKFSDTVSDLDPAWSKFRVRIRIRNPDSIRIRILDLDVDKKLAKTYFWF